MNPSTCCSRTMPILLVALYGLLATPCLAASATLFAWSDLHGKVPPGLKVLVDSARAAGAASGRAVFAFDGGDALFGSPLSQITRGVAQTAELNQLKPDAMTLGLGDFAWDRSRLDSLLMVLDFPVLTANLRRNVDDAPVGNGRAKLLDSAGSKVGVIGIADPELDYTSRPEKNGDMRVDPEEASVAAEVAALRKSGANLVILLCNTSESVAKKLGRIDGVDLVLNAHDHATGSLGRDGDTWTAKLPTGGAGVLRIDLEESENGAWNATATMVAVPNARPTNAAWKAMYASHDSILTSLLSKEVGNLKNAWPTTRREGLLGNWMADALRGGTGADIGLVPASWIRKGLPKGKVRVEDIWNAMPPGLNMVSVFTLPGSDVMKFLERQMRRSKEFLFISGLTCTPDSSMFGGSPISASIGGKLLDKSAYYTIAIPLQLRNDIYELTGISESSAGAEWTRVWESDMVIQWALTKGLATELGRVPPMYGGTAPK